MTIRAASPTRAAAEDGMYREQFSTLREIGRTGIAPGARYDVACLIRMKDEARTLPATIESIVAQRFAGTIAVVFLDSGSTDASLSIAAATPLPHSIHAIDPGEFQFGATCNLVAELASARYLMFLSGHVVLERDDMIAQSVAYMDDHDRVAGLSFRQVPNAATGFNLYEQLYLRRTFPHVAEGYADVTHAGAFSNAASLIRADAWRDVPFEHVIASEDHLWAEAARARGFDVLYSSGFDVAHSHDETPDAVFRRVRINKLARFGDRRQPMRFVRTLLGVFAALTVESRGREPVTALRYALAHAAAYVSATNPFKRRRP